MRTDRSPSRTPAAKLQALRESGTLNPRPGNVRDALFLEDPFFDPQDLAQVRYEMLRRVQKEAMPISAVAATFGFSRPAFYKAQGDFAREGLVGLIPRRRGPRGRHKLTPEILAFVDQIRAIEPSIRTTDIVRRIQERFGTQVHRRSLERALAPPKKNRVCHSCGPSPATATLTEHYETLRGYVLARNEASGLRCGLGALMARGMAAWIHVVAELIPAGRSEPRNRSPVSVPLFAQSEVIQLLGQAVLALVCRGS